MRENDFLEKCVAEMKQLAREVINELPNIENGGVFGKLLRHTNNTQFFAKEYAARLANKMSRLIAEYEGAMSCSLSENSRCRNINIGRSLLRNHPRAIFRGKPFEGIDHHYLEEE